MRKTLSVLLLSLLSAVADPPPVIGRPTEVWWGSYRSNEQLADAGATRWPFVQEHMDGFILHGAYWNVSTSSPAPGVLGPKIADLLEVHDKPVILEHNLAGEYPDIDSAFGNGFAGNLSDTAGFGSAISNIKRLQSYGFPQPDISTDYIMTSWQEAVRWHPEWTSKEFFTALTGSWESYDGMQFNPGAGSADRNRYGWFRQWVERLGTAFPGIRVTSTNSPVYFNWDEGGLNRRELGGSLNNFHAWLKLERRGDTVSALYSGDGSGWAPLGSATVPLGTSPRAGLFVSSLNPARLAQGRFDSVKTLPFFTTDIGRPGRGGTVVVSGPAYTLTGNGSEYLHPGNNTGDAQYYVYREWSGDGSFTVRLDSLENSNAGRTNPAGELASAGITLRESNAAGAKQVSLLANHANQLEFLARTTTGGGLAAVAGSASPWAGLGVQAAPRWLRLTRAGSAINAEHSTDGIVWTVAGTANVSLAADLKVGLVADSQVRFETATAGFSNVSFLTPLATSFSGSDIGSAGSGAASSLAGSTYTLKAAGSGHAGNGDALRLHSTAFTGDGTLLARLSYFADEASPATALAAGAQLGVTFRADTAAASSHATIAFTPQLGLRTLSRTATGGSTTEVASYGAGEVSIQPLGSSYRPLLHYFTGNDFMEGLHESFPGGFSANFAGFTTDSPYAGYQKWGGSETNADALKHREKIILYERWLQARGREHHFIANSTGGSDFGGFNTATQAGRDGWDALFKQQSLRSIQLHQLEGGRPDKVYFESWYDGPFTLVPETQAGTFTNLVADGIRYLKGTGQNLDLLWKAAEEASFTGDLLYQTTPSGPQVKEWRPATNVATRSFIVRLVNRGSVEAFPVIHAHESGGSGWSASYAIGGGNVGMAIRSATGLPLTDSTVRGSELIAPGAAVEVTVTVQVDAPVVPGELLIRAFWNPQDPSGTARDTLRLSLLPPDDPLLNGLGGHWTFDTNLDDLSGLDRHFSGAAVAANPFKQGGGALNLTASGANAASGSALDLGGAFTVSAWIYLPSGANSIRTIAANSAGGFTTSGFRFFVNGFNTSDGKLILETGNGTQALAISSPAATVAFDRWQHVAAVVDRGAGTATLYRNGQPVASGAIRNDFANAAALRIGAMDPSANTLRGTLDELMLHARILDAAEMLDLAGRANAAPSLVAPADLTLTAGTSSGVLAVTVDDAESGAAPVMLTATSSDLLLLPTGNIVVGGSGVNRNIEVTPVAWGAGSVTVTLAASDGLVTTQDSFVLTVSNQGSSAVWTGTGTAVPMPWSEFSRWAGARPPYPGGMCELAFLTGVTLPAGVHVSQQDLASPFTARRLTFGGNGSGVLELQGNPVSLTGIPAIELSGTGALTHRVALPVQLGGNVNVSGDGDAAFEFTGPWSGSAGIVKAGGSRLTLAAANSFSGSTNIQSGVIRAAHAAALGGSGSGTTLQGGTALAALELAAGIAVAEPLQLVMHNTAGHAQLRNVSGSNTLSGPLSLNAGGARWDIASPAGSLTISGPVANIAGGTDTWRTLYLHGPAAGEITGTMTDSASGNSKLNVNVSSGTWTFSGSPKAYTGGTTVSGGTLVANSAMASAAAVLTGGRLSGNGSLVGVDLQGTLAPGQAVGTLATGALALAPDARVEWQLGDWNGTAGTGYDHISSASLNITATPADRVVVEIDAAGMTGFSESPRVFRLVGVTGGITGFSVDRFLIQSPDFPGTVAWSLRQTATALELIYQPSPYLAWIAGFPALTPSQRGLSADPDGDGLDNLGEFAFGGTPVQAAPPWKREDLQITGDGTRLRITLWLRAGAVFDAGAAEIDGLRYEILGSRDLVTPLPVDETALPPGLPLPPAGYETRSFRLNASTSAEPRGFLRVRALSLAP